MSAQATSEQDRSASLTGPTTFAWEVVSATVLPNYAIRVRFADGLEGEVDMRQLIHSPGAGVFAQLADPGVFAAAYVEPTFGAVTWPGEIDLAPDAMYEEIKAHGRWML
jgi:hypothetical protein